MQSNIEFLAVVYIATYVRLGSALAIRNYALLPDLPGEQDITSPKMDACPQMYCTAHTVYS